MHSQAQAGDSPVIRKRRAQKHDKLTPCWVSRLTEACSQPGPGVLTAEKEASQCQEHIGGLTTRERSGIEGAQQQSRGLCCRDAPRSKP